MDATPSAHAAALWVGLHLILLLVLYRDDPRILGGLRCFTGGFDYAA